MLSCKQFKFEVKLDEVRYEAEYGDVGGRGKERERENEIYAILFKICVIFDTIIFVKSYLTSM